MNFPQVRPYKSRRMHVIECGCSLALLGAFLALKDGVGVKTRQTGPGGRRGGFEIDAATLRPAWISRVSPIVAAIERRSWHGASVRFRGLSRKDDRSALNKLKVAGNHRGPTGYD